MVQTNQHGGFHISRKDKKRTNQYKQGTHMHLLWMPPTLLLLLLPPPHPTPFYSQILFISLLPSLFPRSAFGEPRYLKGCLSFHGQQLGVVFSPMIIWFLGGYHWLIGVACAGVMRKLWIIFYSIVSLLMPCGSKFFWYLESSGWCQRQ